jgi:hypothetical protein
MNSETIIARLLGRWQDFHAATRDTVNKWGAFTVACAVIAAFNFVSLVFSFAPWWSFPLAITATAISWALWWPMNCATWFGWIGMLFRLVGALAVSNLTWAVAAAFK